MCVAPRPGRLTLSANVGLIFLTSVRKSAELFLVAVRTSRGTGCFLCALFGPFHDTVFSGTDRPGCVFKVHALKLQHVNGRKARSSSTTQCRAQNNWNDEWVLVRLLFFSKVIFNSTNAPQH